MKQDAASYCSFLGVVLSVEGMLQSQSRCPIGPGLSPKAGPHHLNRLRGFEPCIRFAGQKRGQNNFFASNSRSPFLPVVLCSSNRKYTCWFSTGCLHRGEVPG